ncbi:MAG TPA: helix-hairpin-helix domain-containing protein [Verrucomicrobium sp.]|nr:helix-hairpin-helix domain-containing protein [Verrucomicrobium sp.]
MGELYDDSGAVKRREERKAGERTQNRLFMIGVAVLILAVAAVGLWRMFHDPAKAVININKATVQQLETLPGIGPETARAIVKSRPYATPEDLKKVKGIGDKTFEKMRPRVSVE